MPELPDLEVFKDNILGRLTSKKLVGPEVFNLQKVSAPQQFLLEKLTGRSLLGINRVGKELLFDFGEGEIIAVHLMLNGVISIVNENAVPSIRFKTFSLRFEKEAVVFSDMGGLCKITY